MVHWTPQPWGTAWGAGSLVLPGRPEHSMPTGQTSRQGRNLNQIRTFLAGRAPRSWHMARETVACAAIICGDPATGPTLRGWGRQRGAVQPEFQHIVCQDPVKPRHLSHTHIPPQVLLLMHGNLLASSYKGVLSVHSGTIDLPHGGPRSPLCATNDLLITGRIHARWVAADC